MLKIYCLFIQLCSFILLYAQADIQDIADTNLTGKIIESYLDSANLSTQVSNESMKNELGHTVKKKMKQGLAITTADPDIEILINEKNYGKHKNILIELPTGKYKIIGRKNSRFDDLQKVTVANENVTSISLSPHIFRIQTYRGAVLFKTEGASTWPGYSFELGVRLTKHYINGLLILTDGSIVDIDKDLYLSLIGGGICYNYILFERRHFSIESGALLGGFSYSKRKRFPTKIFEDYSAPVLGPRASISLGSNHVKFAMAVDYLIVLNNKIKIFSKRNFFLFHQGIIIVFG